MAKEDEFPAELRALFESWSPHPDSFDAHADSLWINATAFLADLPDVTVVMHIAAALDEALKRLLEKSFRPGQTATKLLDHKGALGTANARSSVAYVLNLISKQTFQDLQRIESIRNTFAHHWGRRYFAEDQNLVDMCHGLGLPAGASPMRNLDPREMFVALATRVLFLLFNSRPLQLPPEIVHVAALGDG